MGDVSYSRSAVPTQPSPRGAGLADALGRPLRDLRISVTDRCNFRCTYCMPKEVFGRDYAFLPHDQILTFEEIERVARAFVQLGVEKLRITGGEPLVRRNLPDLIGMLAALRRSDGAPQDLTLTTNGSALRALAQPLADAGLGRVTVSLDSLDDAVFGAMNGIDFPVARVLDGIDAALEAGLDPVKVNMVVRRGVNEGSIVPNTASSSESRLTVTRRSPASASGRASPRSADPFVVSVRSSDSPSARRSAASIAMRSGRLRRTSGSPPVIRSFSTPSSTNARATRSSSSNVRIWSCGRNA